MARGIRGVALILVNSYGQVLILQEFRPRPHLGKYAGMFSIPMETCRSGELDAVALQRLIAEELHGLAAKVHVEHERLGVYRVVPKAWVALYRATIEDASLPHAGATAADVGNHRWLDPAEAVRLWLRQGAREMLSDFTAGRTGVVRRHCEAVSKTPTALPVSQEKSAGRLPRW